MKNPYKKSNAKKYIIWEILNCGGYYNDCIRSLKDEDFRPVEKILMEKLKDGELEKTIEVPDTDPHRERTQMIKKTVSLYPEYIKLYWQIKDKKSFWSEYKKIYAGVHNINMIPPAVFYRELNKKKEIK